MSKIDAFIEFPKLFNLGTGNGHSVLEVIQEFEKTNNIKLTYVIGERRPGDVESIYADNQKATLDLGWQCKYNLADALKHSWNWENNYEKMKG